MTHQKRHEKRTVMVVLGLFGPWEASFPAVPLVAYAPVIALVVDSDGELSALNPR